MKATVYLAVDRLSLTVETFKVQFDDPRIVEISGKVLLRGGFDLAHVTAEFWTPDGS